MGLAFLNKKGWHTGSFQNIQKVWVKEEQEQERLRKITEAEKRLKEERHYEDIKKMQVEAGLLPKSHLQRLDWMYEERAIKNTTSEDYLLGKPLQEQPDQTHPDWRPTLCKETTANEANELFTKIHEDPLYLIMKEEVKRRADIANNPLKMNKLKKEIDDLRRGKTHRKKHKTHQKHWDNKVTHQEAERRARDMQKNAGVQELKKRRTYNQKPQTRNPDANFIHETIKKIINKKSS